MRPHAPWYNDILKDLKQNLCAKERIWKNPSIALLVMKDEIQNSTKEYFSMLKRFRREHHCQTIFSASTQERYKEIDKITIATHGPYPRSSSMTFHDFFYFIFQDFPEEYIFP